MQVCRENFASGWIGLSMSLRPSEVDRLIELLSQLKNGHLDHLHIVQTRVETEPNVADVEISIDPESKDGNMSIE